MPEVDSKSRPQQVVDRPLPPLVRYGENLEERILEIAQTWPIRVKGQPSLSQQTSIEHVAFYDGNTSNPIEFSLVMEAIEAYLGSLPECKEKTTCDDILLYFRECDIPSFTLSNRIRPRLKFENCNLIPRHSFIDSELNSLKMVGCNIRSSFMRPTLYINSRVHGEFELRACTFENGIDFSEAVFEKQFRLVNCDFSGDSCSFHKTKFLDSASFENVTFGQVTRFFNTQFESSARFSGCKFCRGTQFEYINFPDDGWFEEGEFELGGNFLACYFPAKFYLGTIDLRRVHFTQCTIDRSQALWTTWPSRFLPDTIPLTSSREIAIPKALRKFVWNFRRIVTQIKTFRLSWGAVRSLGELHILNRLSLALLFFVPVLAGIWPLIRRTYSTYAEWQGEIPNPFVLPTSLALLFLGAVCVTFGQLVYQTFTPELVRRQTPRDHALTQLNDWSEADDSLKWDFLRRTREYLLAIARTDPTRHHPNLVNRHRQLVWIPWRFDWFSTKQLPRLDPAARDKEYEDNSQTPVNTDLKVRFPTLTTIDYISEEERIRIAVEEGAMAEYDLATCQKPAAIYATAALYLVGVLIIISVLLWQVSRVLLEADLLWALLPVSFVIFTFLVWGIRVTSRK